MRGIGYVVGKVIGVKYRFDGVACAFIGGCKNGADACNVSVVVLDGFNCRLRGVARGDRCRQNENVLALDHWQNVITEEQLAANSTLGRDHIDGLVSIEVDKFCARELFGKAGANHLHTVKTQDRIHNGVGSVVRHQSFCHGFCLGEAVFLRGHIDVIVGVAVSGCKMSGRYAQEKVAVFGSDFESFFVWHNFTPFFSLYHSFFHLSRIFCARAEHKKDAAKATSLKMKLLLGNGNVLGVMELQ